MKPLFTLFCFLICFSVFGQNGICFSIRNPGTDSLPGCLLCKTTISGNTDNFSATNIPKITSCGFPKKNIFFSVPADSLGQIRFHALISGCPDGMKAILLDENLEEVSDCIALGVNAPFNSILLENLISNKLYTLVLDIVSTDCRYNIAWRSEVNYGNDAIGDADSIQLPAIDLLDVCTGRELEFSIPPVANADFYDWIVPDFLSLVSKSQNKIKLKVDQGRSNSGVRVTPYSGCKAGEPSPSVSIQGTGGLRENIRFPVCSSQLPFDLDGLTFTQVSFQDKNLTNADGCDSTVSYFPFVFEDSIRVIDTAFCVDEIFEMDGNQFDKAGFFEFVGAPSTPHVCDTSINLILRQSGDIAPEIECVKDTFLNLLSFKWNKIELATDYEITINGGVPIIQSSLGFLYKPNLPGEEVNIKIQPVNERGCSFEAGFATCLAPDLTNLEEKSQANQIKISPNPSTGIFQISSFLKIEKTEVFDFSGRRILVVKGSGINLTNYVEGMYVFKIFTEKGVEVKRVFKN